jgi:hypothetical protein
MLVFAACGGDKEEKFDPATFDPVTDLPLTLKVSSPDFDNGANIPREFTCDGDDRSPLISWERPPEGTQSVAFIMDDPDAPSGIFTHWVIFNLPGAADRLGRGIARGEMVGVQGKNSFGQDGYGGPCPPRGDEAHEYRFLVFALNAKISLEADASAQDVLAAIRGSVIANGELTGMYARS